jgi:hypothetical protein
LPEKIECQIGNHEVVASVGVHEPLFGMSSYIDTLVSSAIIDKPNQSFILRMFDVCIAILPRNYRQYSIFDPHSRNTNGFVDANGSAGLFHFKSLAETVKYLKLVAAGKSGQIDLYPISVKLLRSGANEEIFREEICHSSDNDEAPESLEDVEQSKTNLGKATFYILYTS